MTTETTPNTLTGATLSANAGDTAPMFAPVPAISPSTPGCTPTTSLLRFDGGYEVSMCYRTPDGVAGQAKAGLYASAESGLLWFFSRENAEVLVKVLNGCAINGHRWVFVAPVTTLEFDLWVTSPTGKRWTHGNTQGETAATKSDVAAFPCADEPDAAQDPMVPPSLPTLAAGRQIEATPDSEYVRPDHTDSEIALSTSGRDTPVPATSSTTPGCTPTTGLLHFNGGYEVSMCYRTPEGVAGQAKAGLYASAESGLLWFFSRDNAEVLVKVLDGCSINGHRWVFVAPVTTLEFDLRVTSPTGKRWTHGNTQGVTAATKSDLSAFACADEPETAPDLIVSSVSVSDANPVAGQDIEFHATVRNRGDDAAATPTTIRYYRSEDSTISASDDVSFANDAVAALAASATERKTLDFKAPSTPGTFYLGACVDPVSAESRTGNNCSDGVRVVVAEEPETAPDLIVSGVTVSDTNPVAGQTVVLRATVRNRGDGPATSTTIRYYRSEDSTISASDDVSFANDAVPALTASATESRTYHFRTPSAPGMFYLGACVDPVSAESRTGNNCSNGVRVVVAEEPDAAPADLIVPDVTVSDANPVAGRTIALRATVRNRGDGPATPTTIRFYRSSNSTISAADGELGSDAVPELAASATEYRTYHFTVPSMAGAFYMGACIDSVSYESDTSNNCSDGVPVVVAHPGTAPDLFVDSWVSDPSPAPNQAVEFGAWIRNIGDAPASPTTLRYYRSSDSTINTSDDEFHSDAVAPLAASALESWKFVGTASRTPATFYYGACVDSVFGESDTGNNCSTGARVVVEEPRPPPDLIVDVSVSEANPAPDEEFEIRATVQNRGDGPALTSLLYFLRSDDSTITLGGLSGDTELGTYGVPKLDASAAVTRVHVSSHAHSGTFYFGACVDPVSDESDTNNNCSDGVPVVVE